jgi:hypothetical protein
MAGVFINLSLISSKDYHHPFYGHAILNTVSFDWNWLCPGSAKGGEAIGNRKDHEITF